MATLHDHCADCDAEIVVEVDTRELTQGKVWAVQRVCKECLQKRQWSYE